MGAPKPVAHEGLVSPLARYWRNQLLRLLHVIPPLPNQVEFV